MSSSDDSKHQRMIPGIPGIPGEYLDCYYAPKGTSLGTHFGGGDGEYSVEIILGRPNHLPERSHFEPNKYLAGDSYFVIAKPLTERLPNDPPYLDLMTAMGSAKLFPNEKGFAGKALFAPFKANSFLQAELGASLALSQLLSGCALYLDTPLHIDLIRVREISTSRTYFRQASEFWHVTPGANGLAPAYDQDFMHYAGMYREAISANSPNYRFLCFYKILESISARRARLYLEARSKGKPLSKAKEKVPKESSEFAGFMKFLYPYLAEEQWIPTTLNQIFIPEARGKGIQKLIDEDLRRIRDRISHALMEDGELGIGINDVREEWQIRKWLPLMRCLVRYRMRNDFPQSFIYITHP